MSTTLTVIGNLASDPELRFTPQGKAVASFTVMSSKSRKDEATGKWESVDVTAWAIKAWDKMAEHVAESLSKGDPVVVVGQAAWKSWEKDDGSKGGRMEVNAWHVGVDIKRNPVKIIKTERASVVSDDTWGGAVKADDDIPPF